MFKKSIYNKGYKQNINEWIGGGFWRRTLFLWVIGYKSGIDSDLVYESQDLIENFQWGALCIWNQ